MKRLTYLLALGAILTLGTGCDKEPATDSINTPVPLYVNTWAFTSGDASTDNGAGWTFRSIFSFNATKRHPEGHSLRGVFLKICAESMLFTNRSYSRQFYTLKIFKHRAAAC